MKRMQIGHVLAAVVATIAVLHTFSALAMPVPERRPAPGLVLVWLALLATHATAYGFGERLRDRWGLWAYAAVQALLLFALAVSGVAAPLALALFMAAVVELVRLAGGRRETAHITIAGIALFVLASLVTSDMYRATTAGVVLAATGLIAHALAGLLNRTAAAAGGRGPSVTAGDPRLSTREMDVLRELVQGARNTHIAVRLGISERTVKVHLGSIYQKLGVDSRTGAVAAALSRKLV